MNLFLKKLFRKKKSKKQYEPYVEKDTKCDKCEYLDECKTRGQVVNIQTMGDSLEHYVGLGCNCKHDLKDFAMSMDKAEFEEFCEIWEEVHK